MLVNLKMKQKNLIALDLDIFCIEKEFGKSQQILILYTKINPIHAKNINKKNKRKKKKKRRKK